MSENSQSPIGGSAAELLHQLEQELGVKGPANVLRAALKLAREAAAQAREAEPAAPPAWMVEVAREIGARICERQSYPQGAKAYRDGDHDNSNGVQDSISALRLALERGHVVEARPVRAAEAPSPTPSLQTQGAVEKTREAERILVTVNRSGCLPGCMMPDGAEPCKAFQEQDEAIRAALALFQNALAEADRALQSPPDRREEGSRGDEWQPIATAPTDVPYTADMPDEADGDGMGWAISDDDDRLLFLVWWEQESAGRWTVTKWHPLPASARPSQKEQGDA